MSNPLPKQSEFDALYVTLSEIATRAGVSSVAVLSWIGKSLPPAHAKAGRTFLWERAVVEPTIVVLEEQRIMREKVRALTVA